MKIAAHVLLKNESRYAWYSIMSVLPYVDRIRIWDMGSTDDTLKIINEIKRTNLAKEKDLFQVVEYKDIKFNEKEYRQKMLETENGVDFEYPMVRELMLGQTISDWFIVVDADEIWWDDSIKLVTDTIRKEGDNLESIVVPTINMIGDMYHFQENEAGRYHLAGKVGHYALRAINRKIEGLHGQGEHGVFMWADENKVKIESRDQNKIKFLNAPYIHTTHLKRSDTLEGEKEVYKRAKKLKYEIGIETPKDFFYPEIFFRSRPSFVKFPWETPSLKYKFIANIETPLKKFRRRYMMKGVKHGY